MEPKLLALKILDFREIKAIPRAKISKLKEKDGGMVVERILSKIWGRIAVQRAVHLFDVIRHFARV